MCIILSFQSYFSIKCILFPVKQQQQQYKLKNVQNKMQHKRAKFQNTIKSSTVVQLGQNYCDENIMIWPRIIQMSVVLNSYSCWGFCNINRMEQIFYNWLLKKWYWYFKTKQVKPLFLRGTFSISVELCLNWTFYIK